MISSTIYANSLSISNTNEEDILDNTCINKIFSISNQGKSIDVTLKIDIEHTFREDLNISLKSPQDTLVNLTDSNGGDAENLSVNFSDESTDRIINDTHDHNLGEYHLRKPDHQLSHFDDEDINGTWTLIICDTETDDDGSFKNATLSIDYIPDTDGDGIYDNEDIDDDNDGILDTIEMQGGGNCSNGFFQVVSGQLYLFDSTRGIYTPIGEQHFGYNDLGYDKNSGNLYAVVKEAGQDDYGTSVSKGDIIEIDRYRGLVKKVGEGGTGNSGDFYNGILYNKVGNSATIKRWHKSDGSIDTISPSTKLNGVDLSIIEENDKVYAYSLTTTNNTSGESNNVKLTRWELDTNNVRTKNMTISTPDGADLADGWGASFVTENNTSEPKLYFANNNGYLYEIKDFNTSSPFAVFYVKTKQTSNNDGASCRNANQNPIDTDSDGIPDYLDLDSDNDGIPDNIEAQLTNNYIAPSGSDTDNDGLDDAYDESDGGTTLALPDTDNDNKADFVDTDSDNDGYSDCEEGNPHAICNNITIGDNGMPTWASNGNDYSDINGNIDTFNNLFNETGNSNEIGFREFLCGKTNYQLSSYKWRLISIPCDTGSLSIKDLFGDILGEYDAHWVMYKQSGDDNYEVYNGHKNTDKIKLTENDTLEVGVSYWIITDADKTLTIDKTLNGLSPTPTTTTQSISINNDFFNKVFEFNLPANSANHVKKFMTGNPFPYKINFSSMYFKNRATNYKIMGHSTNDNYILARIYTHNSSDLSDKNVSNGGGYTVIAPQTPGLSEGQILPMEGFFLQLNKQSNEKTNKLAYPLMMQYGNLW